MTHKDVNLEIHASSGKTSEDFTKLSYTINDLNTQTAAQAAPNIWVEAYPHGVYDEGSIGGDIQTGPAWSRRFVAWLPDRPERERWAVLTDSYYTCEDERRDGSRVGFIQNQTEVVFCSNFVDPGDTESRSDTRFRQHFYHGMFLDHRAKEHAEVTRASDFATPTQWYWITK